MSSVLGLILSIDPRARIAIAILILTLQVFVLFFPTDLFMMYLGLIYGTFFGMWINLISYFGMTLLGYQIGRIGNFGLDERTNPKAVRIQTWIEKYGLKALVLNRLIPIIPLNFVSYGAGLAEIDRKKYLIISILCMLPWAFIWAFIGSNFLQLALDYLPSSFNPVSLLIGFVIFMVATAVLTIYKQLNQSSE